MDDATEGATALAHYYDWDCELSEDGANGLCVLCPDCGNDREIAGQAQYAGPFTDHAGSVCDDCGA